MNKIKDLINEHVFYELPHQLYAQFVDFCQKHNISDVVGNKMTVFLLEETAKIGNPEVSTLYIKFFLGKENIYAYAFKKEAFPLFFDEDVEKFGELLNNSLSDNKYGIPFYVEEHFHKVLHKFPLVPIEQTMWYRIETMFVDFYLLVESNDFSEAAELLREEENKAMDWISKNKTSFVEWVLHDLIAEKEDENEFPFIEREECSEKCDCEKGLDTSPFLKIVVPSPIPNLVRRPNMAPFASSDSSSTQIFRVKFI